MTDNAYIEALKKSPMRDVKMISSPKRQIVQNQKGKCYMCERPLSDVMCQYEVVEGPDMKTGMPSKELRALCAACFTHSGKNPKKEMKKIPEKKEKPKKERIPGDWVDEMVGDED